MDKVARHAGVARASVYNNFGSKDEIFLATMRRGIERFTERALVGDDVSRPPDERLRLSATGFLAAATESDSIEMYRMVVALTPRFPELGQLLHERGLTWIEDRFAKIARLAGAERIPDPVRFAAQLLALLMGGYFGRRLLGIESADPGAVEREVDSVLAALAPDG